VKERFTDTNISEESYLKNNVHIPALTTLLMMRAVLFAMLGIVIVQRAEAGGMQNGPGSNGSDPAFYLVMSDSAGHKEIVTTTDDDADTTEYESTTSTPYEQAALIGANAVLIPIALGAAALSVAPPDVGVLVDHGVSYASLGFETGIGVGAQTETGRFSDARLMLNYTHLYSQSRHDLWRIEAVKDVNLFTVGKRGILAFGVSPMIGLYTDGPARGYSIGSSVRLMLPSLPYVGMFPLHTLGVTYRFNKTFGGGEFHTAVLGISAAVVF
jgi:hypothetical protein